jgi:hypothetical protein
MTLIHPTNTADAEVIHHLLDALDKDTISLGKDRTSICVRDGVKALRTAFNGGAGTVAAALRSLEATVDRLHMSHMRPFFKQTLRALRTESGLDVQYPVKAPPVLQDQRRNNTNNSFTQGRSQESDGTVP